MDDFKDIEKLVFYHGTTEQLWITPPEPDLNGISLTTHPDDAINYASDAGEFDYALFHENTDQDDSAIKQIIVKIPGTQLLDWLKSDSLSAEPDDGWLTASNLDNSSWQESLAACGCIYLKGFSEPLKSQIETISVEELENELSVRMA